MKHQTQFWDACCCVSSNKGRSPLLFDFSGSRLTAAIVSEARRHLVVSIFVPVLRNGTAPASLNMQD